MKTGRYLKSFLQEEIGSTERINQEECLTLLEITKGCRASMHEPDEQEVSAELQDGSFDNAGGYEMALILYNQSDNTTMRKATMNMASLVALARIGADAYLNAHNIEH